MKSKLLLPNRFKWIGLVLLVPSLVLGLLFMYADFTIPELRIVLPNSRSVFSGENNLTDELALTCLILSLMMIAFAREKEEDEFIHYVRLESWQWAVVINFALLLAAIWLVYEFAFLKVMIYNMLTILVIFIIRFHWIVFRNKKAEVKSFAL